MICIYSNVRGSQDSSLPVAVAKRFSKFEEKKQQQRQQQEKRNKFTKLASSLRKSTSLRGLLFGKTEVPQYVFPLGLTLFMTNI